MYTAIASNASNFNYAQRVDDILSSIFTKKSPDMINCDIIYAAEFSGVVSAARQCRSAAEHVNINSDGGCRICNVIYNSYLIA